MSFFTRLFGGSRNIAAAPVEAEARSCDPTSVGSFSLFNTINGGDVTEDTVKRVPVAFGAIKLISNSIAALRLEAFEETANGAEKAKSHPLWRILNAKPHANYTKFSFLQSLVWNGLLGNGYARIHRDPRTMRATSLELLPATSVMADYDRLGNLFYRVSGIGYANQVVNVIVPNYDMIHVKNITTDGVTGERIHIIHQDSFGAAAHGQKWGRKFFENSAQVRGIMTVEGSLSPKQIENIKSQFDRKYSGSEKVGSTAVLDGGMKYQKIGLDPKEAALVDFRHLTAQEVSNIFSIPMHMLAQLERSTFTNMEQQSAEYVRYCLMPLCEQIEGELTTKCFMEAEQGRFFAQFDLDALMRGDMKARAEFYRTMVSNGIMTPNEAREREGLNHIDGGDSLFMQINMTTLERIGQEPTATALPDGGAADDENDPIPEPAKATN